MSLARSQRLFELLLLVDVEHDSAQMTGCSAFILDQATAGADPVCEPRRFTQPVGNVEIAAAFDRSLNGLLSPLTVARFQQGKEKIVTNQLVAGNAEKSAGDLRPDQFLCR